MFPLILATFGLGGAIAAIVIDHNDMTRFYGCLVLGHIWLATAYLEFRIKKVA